MEAYYVSYTFNNNYFQLSTSENNTIITVIDDQNCKYTLCDVRIIAGNAIGNTTLFERNVDVSKHIVVIRTVVSQFYSFSLSTCRW